MRYTIGLFKFVSKAEITKRCQEIRDSTPDGNHVSQEDFDFLIPLFRYHDEWHEKSYPDVDAISTQTTEHGTRGFILIRTDGTQIDISYPHTIKHIPNSRSAVLTPQALLDYKAAARSAVQDQVREFRDLALSSMPSCPIVHISLARGNCDVHYPPPLTFERILFNFTLKNNIYPLRVIVDSCGTVAKFHSVELRNQWAAYHRQHAKLQLVSTEGRLGLAKCPTDWSSLV